MLHPGVQERILAETTTAAGTTSKEGVIQSDSLLCTLWVDSVSSGSLDVSVYTLTDTGKEALLFSFPTALAATPSLVLRQSSVSMSRFIVRATYTGVCQYEVYVRAVSGASSTTSPSGPAPVAANQITQDTVVVSSTPTELYTGASRSSLRRLVRVYNSGTQTCYLGPAGVTSSGADIGEPLPPLESLTYTLGDVGLYAVVASGTCNLLITELSYV
jgi:hypothetical protein